MKWILQTRDLIKSFYEKYDTYLNGLFRFLFALCLFLTITYNTGYNVRIANPVIPVLLALICAFLPKQAIPIFMSILILLSFMGVSLEVVVVTGIFMMLMLLLYFVFKAGNSLLMAVALLFCLWKMPAAILPMALLLMPLDILAVAFGILLYGILAVIKKDFSVLSGTTLTLGARVNLFLSDLFSNERFLLVILSVVVCMLMICLIRRSRINYSPLVAIVAGDFLFFAIMLVGNYFTGIELNFMNLFISLVINVLLAVLIIELWVNLNYRHTEQVQFEDDDYYYYVKAIPKRNVSAFRPQVESIVSDEEEAEEEESFDLNDVFVRPDEEGEE